MLCLTPIALLTLFLLHKTLRKGIIIGRKTWESALGFAEEIIYNKKLLLLLQILIMNLKDFTKKLIYLGKLV